MKKIALIFFCLMATTLFAKPFKKGTTVYIAVKIAEIKKSESNYSEVIGAAAYGRKFIVLESNEKRTQVQLADDKTRIGWVSTGSLTKKKVFNTNDKMASTTLDEISISGKGFSEEAENAYKTSNKNLNYEEVDKIEKIEVFEEALLSFVKEGNLKLGTE